MRSTERAREAREAREAHCQPSIVFFDVCCWRRLIEHLIEKKVCLNVCEAREAREAPCQSNNAPIYVQQHTSNMLDVCWALFD